MSYAVFEVALAHFVESLADLVRCVLRLVHPLGQLCLLTFEKGNLLLCFRVGDGCLVKLLLCALVGVGKRIYLGTMLIVL